MFASQAREAIRSASSLLPATMGGRQMWAGRETPSHAPSPAHLLPPFDQYLLGYRDRSGALDPSFAQRVNAGGGMPRASLIVKGKVAGVWKQTRGKDRMTITLEPFRVLPEEERLAVKAAVERCGRYHDSSVRLQVLHPLDPAF